MYIKHFSSISNEPREGLEPVKAKMLPREMLVLKLCRTPPTIKNNRQFRKVKKAAYKTKLKS